MLSVSYGAMGDSIMTGLQPNYALADIHID